MRYKLMPLTLRQPRGLTACYGSVALTATGAETVYDTTGTPAFSLDGKAVASITAVTDGTTPTTDGNTSAAFTALAANEGCVFVWAVADATTWSVRQGPVTALDSVSGAFSAPDAPQFPFIPDSVCPVAYHIVKNGSTGSAWTFGSSNWNATGITNTIVNVSTLPVRPQTS